MIDVDSFFPIAQGTLPRNQFWAKFGFIGSFNKAAFQNALQYRYFDSKMFNSNILSKYILCKFDKNWSSNPRDYKSNKSTFLNETAKIGPSHQIPQQLLDQSSTTFQLW